MHRSHLRACKTGSETDLWRASPRGLNSHPYLKKLSAAQSVEPPNFLIVVVCQMEEAVKVFAKKGRVDCGSQRTLNERVVTSGTGTRKQASVWSRSGLYRYWRDKDESRLTSGSERSVKWGSKCKQRRFSLGFSICAFWSPWWTFARQYCLARVVLVLVYLPNNGALWWLSDVKHVSGRIRNKTFEIVAWYWL